MTNERPIAPQIQDEGLPRGTAPGTATGLAAAGGLDARPTPPAGWTSGQGAGTPGSEPFEPPARRASQTAGWIFLAILVPVGLFGLLALGAVLAMVLEGIMAGSSSQGIESADALIRGSIFGQLLALAVFLPVWLHVRRRAFGPLRAHRFQAPEMLVVAVSIVAIGLGVQMSLSYLLDFILSFMPDLAEEYAEIMEAAGTTELSVLSALTVAVLAPVLEEIACRGVLFEFLMRAMHPGWNARTGAEGVTPRKPAVVAAILLTSLIFGALHMNIVQSAYAFPMGVLLSWVYWRTGNLGYSIALHLVVNFSSFGVEFMSGLLAPLGDAGAFAVSCVPLLIGIIAFARVTGRRAQADAGGAQAI